MNPQPAGERPAVAALWATGALPVAATVGLDPGGWYPFGPAKWAAVSVIAMVALATSLRMSAVPVAGRIRLAWAVFLGWAALCALAGLDRFYAWTGTPERHLGVLTWLLCLGTFVAGHRVSGLGRRAVEAVAVGAAVAATLMGIYAAVEAWWRAPIALDATSGRLGGPFGSAAYLGAAGCLLLPTALGLGAAARGWRRWLGWSGAVGAAFAVGGAGTRAAWVGLGMAVLVVGVARRRGGSSVRVVAAGAVVLCAMVTGAMASSTGSRATDVTSSRSDEWRIAARVIAAHPVVGVGPEGYRIAFPGEVDAAYERAHGRSVVPDRAHDVLADQAAALGMPGLVLFVLLLAAVAGPIGRTLRQGSALGAALAAGAVAYVTQQLFLFPLGELEPVLWLVLGLIVGTAPARTEPADTAPGGTARRSTSARGRPVAVSAAFAGAGLLAVLGGLDVAADRAAHASLRARTPAAAVAPAQRARRLRPDVLRYRLVAARALAGTGVPADLDRALGVLDHDPNPSPADPIAAEERATLLGLRARRSRDPGDLADAVAAWRLLVQRDRFNAHRTEQLGLALADAGDLAGAAAPLEAADGLAPRDPQPTLELARLYQRLGRHDDAAAAARRALAKAPKDPSVRAVAAEIERSS